jgi:hypothetical protein
MRESREKKEGEGEGDGGGANVLRGERGRAGAPGIEPGPIVRRQRGTNTLRRLPSESFIALSAFRISYMVCIFTS